MTAPLDLEIRINPEYESLVPPMTKEAFESFVSSIRVEGQHEPITINDKGEILDGHHRYRACKLLGIELTKPTVKTSDNPLREKLYVIEVNLQRRQLTEAQKVQLSLKKKPILEKLARFNQSLAGKSYGWGKHKKYSSDSSVHFCTELSELSPYRIGRVNEVIAKDCGVSARQVSKIETILERAPEELKQRVLAGTTAVDKAFRKIRKNELRAQLIKEASMQSKIDFPDSAGIQLIHGDFIEKSKEKADESIDLIFTDPPYDKEHLYLYGELANVAARVLKPGASLIVYAAQHMLPQILRSMEIDGLTYWWEIAVRHNGASARMHGQHVFIGWKPMLWYVKGTSVATPEYISDFIESDFIESESPDKVGHDWAQSPVEAEYVISKLTVENQIVFDPMMGYATTGIATVRLNRKFIGIEKDKEHFKTAQLRIGKELAEKK